MLYLFVSLFIAGIAIIPLLQVKYFPPAGVVFVFFTLLLWALQYGQAVSFAGPMFGNSLFFVFVFSTFSLITCFIVQPYFPNIEQQIGKKVLLIPVGSFVLLVMLFASSLPMFRADEYKQLVGNMENRVWTQDVQPKDPQHFRSIIEETALYLARKAVGELGTVGSQFQVGEKSVTLQIIKDELWYVIPLDFAGYRAWTNTKLVIGYIMIHAEDPNRQPVVKQLPKEKQFVYTPGAWFGKNLIRHIRLKGYLRVELEGTHLEIDDEGTPWWVTSVLEPTIGQFGEKVTGAVLTHPVTGECQFFALGNVPKWVDRVIPRTVTKRYLISWGNYVHGWVNSWWEKKDLTEPEEPSLVYSSEHTPVFVTGITSQNSRDDSLVGVVYTDTHTGKSVFYEVKGGATDNAVLLAVEKFQDVQYRKLQPADPQLYNLYGVMSSVVPLVNENFGFSGVAIVPIGNVQNVFIGRSLSEALRHYQKDLIMPGGFVAMENVRVMEVAEGIIDRVKQDVTPNGSVYYVLLRGVKHAFVGGTEKFPTIPLTDVGDKVRIGYYGSLGSTVPMHTFTNETLQLDQSEGELSAKQRAEASQSENEAKPARHNVGSKLQDATPDQIKRIEGILGSQRVE